MLNVIRRLFSSELPHLRSAAVQEWLQRQVQLLMEGVRRLAARQMIDEVLGTARQQGLTDPKAVAQLLAEARSSDRSIPLPYTTVRLSMVLAEVTLAVADCLNEEDAASVTDTLARLLTLSLYRPCDAEVAATLLAVHGETVAALLPDGWGEALIDVPQFRDEGHGLLVGNALADQLIRGGWSKRSTLKKDVADLIVTRLAEQAPDAPVPAERPFLGRRHPARWQALAVAAGAEPARASTRGRPEATEALLRRLVNSALADRLEDRLLNGEQPDEEVEIPRVLGLAVIDMAAFAKGHRDKLQPAAEVEAARLLRSVFGLDEAAAGAAAQRLAAFRRAVVDSYDGLETPGLPKGEGLAVLSYAQTRGRKLGEFIKLNVDAADAGALSAPDIEIRAVARLFRFAAAFATELPDLPRLGSRPAPDRASAERALVGRFRAAGLPDSFVDRWRADDDVRGRLQRLFAAVDRLLPHPEYIDVAELPVLAKHYGTDEAGALDRNSVSVALQERDALLFLSVLSLRLFEDLALTREESFALLRLLAERAQVPSGHHLKMMARNDWLADRTLLAVPPFQLAQAVLREGAAAEPWPWQRLVELGKAFAHAMRDPQGASTSELEQEVRTLLLITPEVLRRTSRL